MIFKLISVESIPTASANEASQRARSVKMQRGRRNVPRDLMLLHVIFSYCVLLLLWSGVPQDELRLCVG